MANRYDDDDSSTSTSVTSDSDTEFEGFGPVKLEKIEEVRQVDPSEISDIELSDWEVESSDEEGELSAQPTWNSEVHDVEITGFNPAKVGPNHLLNDDAGVLDFFNLFVGDDMFKLMAVQTNLYADQCIAIKADPKWEPTPIDGTEMKAYLAMNMMMGIVRMPNCAMYWSDDHRLNAPAVSSVMTKSRFRKLNQYFHLVDNTKAADRNSSNFDHLFKIRPLLDSLIIKFCQHYYPHKELSIDEAMVGLKGRLSMNQYVPAKPKKWGIKVWQLCDPHNGYCCNLQVYTGMEAQTREKGLGHRVVVDLTSPFMNVGHHVYYNNFFSNVPLAQELQKKKTYICSTVRLNRKGLPQDIQGVKLKQPGQVMRQQAGNLLLTVWFDKRQVSVLSTNQNPTQSNVTRKDGQVVVKPDAIINYNKYKRGVDLFDQLRSHYSVGRECKKWWKYLAWYLFNMAIINAYLLYQESVPVKRKKRYSQLDFRLDLEAQLRAGFSSRKHRIGRTPKRTIDCVAPENQGGHESIRMEGRKRVCRQCAVTGQRTKAGRKRETSFMCKLCKVPLCQANCHRDYHA